MDTKIITFGEIIQLFFVRNIVLIGNLPVEYIARFNFDVYKKFSISPGRMVEYKNI